MALFSLVKILCLEKLINILTLKCNYLKNTLVELITFSKYYSSLRKIKIYKSLGLLYTYLYKDTLSVIKFYRSNQKFE